MNLMTRWFNLMNTAARLNQEVPWIYSDKWYEMFEQEMHELLRLSDEELDDKLKELEKEYNK